MRVWTVRGLVASCVVVLMAAGPVPAAPGASRFQTLYTFTGGNDGGWPAGNLIADKGGNLYGTTSVGGPNGAGTVFKLAPDGTESVLHSFTGATDGDLPLAGLLMDDAGNLYGTTEIGGKYGWGNVFKVTPRGVTTSLYDFNANGTDGINPVGALIWGKHHELLGTTLNGGSADYGTVFSVTLGGTETILHDFDGTNGRYPPAGLVMDPQGNVFGTTFNSRQGSSGTVYEITAGGQFRTLVTLSNKTGYFPHAALTLDGHGNLYGTASAGGKHDYGTVFKLTAYGDLQVLYSFTNGADGSDPVASIFIDGAGNLLSTTNGGGTGGYGTVFSLAPNGTLSTLYTFDGATGSYSQAGLIRDRALGLTWLYGTTYTGGSGNGLVYRVKP